MENIEEGTVVLTAQLQQALDHELAAIAGDPAYLRKWRDVKSRFKKP